MSEDQGPVCFTCGEPTGVPPRLNTLADGSVCPGCRRRLEETLPPLLPGFGQGLPEGYEAPREIHVPIPLVLRSRRVESADEPDRPQGA